MMDMLIRHLIESTFLCVALGSFAYGLRGQAAAVRYSLWLISVLKFAIPTAFLAAAGAWIAFLMPATAWISSVAASISGILARLFGIASFPIRPGNDAFALTTFLIVWVFGSGILFRNWIRHLRMAHHGMFAASAQEQAAFDRVHQKLGLRKPVALRRSAERKEPALVGVFRPFVAIPVGLSEQLTESEFEAVLLHELAHARRRDNLAGAFVHCLICLFWFHPLLWFVEKQLILERERACDEMVIDSGMRPEIYLAGLIKICRLHLLGAVAGVSQASGSVLRLRFDHILAYRKSYRIPYLMRLAIGGFVLSMALLPIAHGYCEQCVSNGRDVTQSRTRFGIIHQLSAKEESTK